VRTFLFGDLGIRPGVESQLAVHHKLRISNQNEPPF
jgi:hypothetical protein